MWALHGLPTKSPLAKQKVGPWPRNCHVTRSDCVFVGPVSSASALCKPTRHCPKHMSPFSRISIQRTSTNQICETPYLNECKNVIPTTSTNHKLSHLTSSLHEFHLDTYEATHEIYTSPSLGSLASALKAGNPQIFPPKNQLRVLKMASMQGHPFRRENTMGLNYIKLLYHQNFCQEMSKDGKMPTLQSILKGF